MTRFVNGPAAGITLGLRRAPLYLRVARMDDVDGKVTWDALDQLDDKVRPGETLYAYRKVPGSDQGVVCIRRAKGGGCFHMAEYSVVEPQPDQDTMRHAGRWRRWCEVEVAETLAGDGEEYQK
jgi:hypothetical protein